MNYAHQGRITSIITLIAAITFSATPVQSGGFLDKLKAIEKATDLVTKPPKIQTDVGGVKLDLSTCSAKTGVKTIDKATKAQTKDSCKIKKSKHKPGGVVNVNDTKTDMDNDVDW